MFCELVVMWISASSPSLPRMTIGRSGSPTTRMLKRELNEYVPPRSTSSSPGSRRPIAARTSSPGETSNVAAATGSDTNGRRARAVARGMRNLLEIAMPFLARHFLRSDACAIPVSASQSADNVRQRDAPHVVPRARCAARVGGSRPPLRRRSVRVDRPPGTKGEDHRSSAARPDVSLRRPFAAARDSVRAGRPSLIAVASLNLISSVFVHVSSYVDQPCEVGEGSRIWHFSHVMMDCRIGRRCNIGHTVLIPSGCVVGDTVKIQPNVSVYPGLI